MIVSLSYCSLTHIASGLELLVKEVDTYLKPKDRSFYQNQEHYALALKQYSEIREEITGTLEDINKGAERWLGEAAAMDKVLGIPVVKFE
jgi:hypothetical protein